MVNGMAHGLLTPPLSHVKWLRDQTDQTSNGWVHRSPAVRLAARRRAESARFATGFWRSHAVSVKNLEFHGFSRSFVLQKGQTIPSPTGRFARLDVFQVWKLVICRRRSSWSVSDVSVSQNWRIQKSDGVHHSIGPVRINSNGSCRRFLEDVDIDTRHVGIDTPIKSYTAPPLSKPGARYCFDAQVVVTVICLPPASEARNEKHNFEAFEPGQRCGNCLEKYVLNLHWYWIDDSQMRWWLESCQKLPRNW